MRVKVLSRGEIEAGHADGADAVISIRPAVPVEEPDLASALARATDHEPGRLLRLCFDDIGMARYGHFVGPSLEQIDETLRFGRAVAAPSPLFAVHCEFGKSRSSAIALALLADRFGAGHEDEAVDALIAADVQNRFHPNPWIVELADTCLDRAGRLDAALARRSPRYVKWRDLWVKISADPDSYWDIARQALAARSGDDP